MEGNVRSKYREAISEPIIIRRVDQHTWVGPHGSEGKIIEKRVPVEGISDFPVRQAEVNIYVPEEHRNKGIGTELLKKIIEVLENENIHLEKEHRIYRLFAQPTHHLASHEAATRLFEKLGFKPYDNGWYYKFIKNF